MSSLKAHLHLLLLLIILPSFLHKTTQEYSSGFTLNLIPWDSPNSSPIYQPNLTQAQKAHTMAISSKARANHHYLYARKHTSYYENEIVQIPVKYQDLRYAVTIRIGQPPKEASLLLDTGSGPIWTKCKPGSRFDYDPTRSRYYRTLPCSHPFCRMASSICKCINSQCVCTLKYGLASGIQEVRTVLASDSFALPAARKSRPLTFNNMVFGCSSQSPIFSGILGMDKLPVSLINQVKGVVQGRYSYCLHSGDGYLRFGNETPLVGRDFKTVRLIHPKLNNLWLELLDISVLEKRLRLSPSLFSLENGGFLTDTGSTFTVLNKQAYDRVIRVFANYYSGRGAQRVNGVRYGLDLCYRLGSMFGGASMTFHFRGADYVTNHLFVSPEEGVACVALMSGEISILGALQQFDTRFVFDMYRYTMSFARENCSRDRA